MINFLLPEKDTEDIMNKFIYFQKGEYDRLEGTWMISSKAKLFIPRMAGCSSQ